MLLMELLFEENQQFNYGPVYHGGVWDGIKPIRTSGRGALGSGAYFSPIKSVAEQYARESGGKLTTAYLTIHNPLKIYMQRGSASHPCVQALVKLGIPQEKAENKVEKVEELKGYMGTEISKLAVPQGYDGIFEYFDGELREIVIWNAYQVKASMGE